jgi:hypothetical protein
MAWKSTTPNEAPAQVHPAAEEDHETHEPPRGALLITCGYLVLIVALWLEVYLQLLNNGGVLQP